MGGKNFCYVVIFLVATLAVLIIAASKTTVGFAIVIGVLAFFVLQAIYNS